MPSRARWASLKIGLTRSHAMTSVAAYRGNQAAKAASWYPLNQSKYPSSRRTVGLGIVILPAIPEWFDEGRRKDGPIKCTLVCLTGGTVRKAVAESPRWNTGPDFVRRYVLGDDCTRRDDRAVADSNASDDDGSATQPAVRSDDGSALAGTPCKLHRHAYLGPVVIVANDGDIGCEHRVATNSDQRRDVAVPPDEDIRASDEVARHPGARMHVGGLVDALKPL